MMHFSPISLIVGLIVIAVGCGNDNKWNQIRRGVDGVDAHAKEIQREAQGPRKITEPE
jgi:hypothetical protein